MAIALRRGTRLGKYRLDSRLGQGAFAEVWRARDLVEKRSLALKVTQPDVVSQFGRDAVELEAFITSRLQHPNIVAVRNADWIDGRFVIATDLAIGNLESFKRNRRSSKFALQVVRDVAAGLAHAHDQKILHRDVKPENILIFDDGRAAVSDFGASKFAKGASETYTEAGTLGYMAPEQAYGRPRFTSDVFSLGLIAYELFTGVLLSWPFDWPPDRHDRFVSKVPESVQPILRKAAEFNPTRRYENARMFHEAIEAAVAQEEARRVTPRRRRRTPRHTPSPLLAGARAFQRMQGRHLGMRYDCYRCEGPISESMSFCPWCGTGENSFRAVTSYPLVCPECERGVRAEWSACPWCYKGRFESNGRAPRHDSRATRRCGARGCAGQLRPFMRYCPLCKRKVARPWRHPDLPDRCPRCRWPTFKSFLRFCPWCGRREVRAGVFPRTRG
ncbi:serine/threonine-protein kinase [Myxococcota bacterium]|nr:serine/threonine-protein kinase [Myxococcota bacterium]